MPRRYGFFLLCLFVVMSAQGVADDRPPAVDFSHEVVPILRQHCVECHGGAEAKGGFSLNSRATVLDASAAIPGDAGGSRIIELVTSTDPNDQMPPKDRPRLSSEEITTLERWIGGDLLWEDGFTFDPARYEPPLHPRQVELPPVQDGRTNPIDRILDAYRAEHGLPAPPSLDDAAFMRRVSLDVVGLLPKPEDVRNFVADPSADKRNRLIANLLADRRAYTEHWLTFWSDLLRNNYAGTGFIDDGRRQITEWLYGAIFTNKPYDQFVQELITPAPDAAGFIRGIKWRGDVNSSQTTDVQFAQSLGQVFLGINLKCASCHDSFIDRWTLDETYNLAAVYATQPLEIHRCDVPTGRFAKAAWIFPELGQIDSDADQPQRLQQLAEIMTNPENGRLTRTIVNRLWHRLMGRGIVHPVDAMQTKPWSDDLLDFLAWDLREHQYDLKHTIALIAGSQAYQSQAAPKDTSGPAEEFIFSGPLAKRLTAEQFVDAIHSLAQTWPAPGGNAFRKDGRGQGGQLAAILRAEERAAGSTPLDALIDEPLVQSILSQSRWIWKDRDALAVEPKSAAYFRRKLEFPAADHTVVLLAVDGKAHVFLNGRQLAEHQGLKKIVMAEATHRLKDGENILAVRVENDGNEPNPAGLMIAVCGLSAEGDLLRVTSGDETWLSTAEESAGWDRSDFDDSQWAPSTVIGDVTVEPWKLASEFNGQKLTIQRDWASLWGDRPVRASLAPQDGLQLTLGRPIREQIVTSRPEELTTLEAITLSNGEAMANMLHEAAEKLLANSREKPAPDLVDWLYMATLSRSPTPEEAAIAVDLLGDPVTLEGVEDLLWAVLMLPEFQLVR